ncbi:MAG: hypothetical protein ACXABY_15900, partial [Candidatus Thorarchaeota archaeon]
MEAFDFLGDAAGAVGGAVSNVGGGIVNLAAQNPISNFAETNLIDPAAGFFQGIGTGFGAMSTGQGTSTGGSPSGQLSQDLAGASSRSFDTALAPVRRAGTNIGSVVDALSGTDGGGHVQGTNTTTPTGPTQAQIVAQQQAEQAAAEAAERARLTEEFNRAHGIIGETAGTNLASEVAGRGLDINEMINARRAEQLGLFNSRVNTEAGRIGGVRDITRNVGQGIRSVGNLLNSRNAGDSSASGAAARAFGQLGNRQIGDVNNQAALAGGEFDIQQGNINTRREDEDARFQQQNQQFAQDVFDSTRQQLGELQALMQQADLPTRIAIEQEAQALKQNALTALGQLDAQLAQRGSEIRQAPGQDV